MVGGMSQRKLGRFFLEKHIRSIFYGSITLIFTIGVYESVQLYIGWAYNEFGKYYLPPFQSLDYYFISIFPDYFAPYIFSLIIALAFLYVSKRYNKKFDNKFFEKEEIYLGAISIFLVAHPGWVLYLFVFFGSYFVFQIVSQFLPKLRGQRLPLYHFWVPSAIFVILITEYLLADNIFWLRLGI